MSATSFTSRAGAGASDVPHLDIDPISKELMEDPHPVHEVRREAGPVVRLDK
jgi:hypothetical protein